MGVFISWFAGSLVKLIVREDTGKLVLSIGYIVYSKDLEIIMINCFKNKRCGWKSEENCLPISWSTG